MRRRKGFTLIELLAAIAIIAVLIALLLPAVQAWVDGTYSYGMYDHHYAPNSTFFDCITVDNSPSQGWKGARSRQPGGANVLFGDGSIHFFKNSIDGGTWAAVGIRAGGEVISSQF